MITGLQYIPAYLSAEGQASYLATVDSQPWLSDLKRRVQHYDYRYDYQRRALDESLYLGTLPEWAATVAHRRLCPPNSPTNLSSMSTYRDRVSPCTLIASPALAIPSSR